MSVVCTAPTLGILSLPNSPQSLRAKPWLPPYSSGFSSSRCSSEFLRVWSLTSSLGPPSIFYPHREKLVGSQSRETVQYRWGPWLTSGRQT